jgi:NAD(P)-dependent dehydrogenase (short-subunit alcohol dehydrogenase family)
MLSGKIALVTNVNHYVGVATALMLQQYNATVRCHDMSFSDPEKLTEFKIKHPSLTPVTQDATCYAIDEVVDDLGKIDIVVINDFYPAIKAAIDDATVQQFKTTLDLLLVVPFTTVSSAARHMKKNKEGKIVFVTSAAPFRGLKNYSMYVAARGGCNSLAQSVALELAPYNIQVNGVAPNYVENESYFPAKLVADSDIYKKLIKNVPLGRLGKPSEVAETIAFLASKKADFITGQIIPVAGGWA